MPIALHSATDIPGATGAADSASFGARGNESAIRSSHPGTRSVVATGDARCWTSADFAAGGADVGLNPITCEMAVAAALWIKNEVQPLAMEMFGKSVDRIRDMGTYDCRNIVGNRKWAKMRSQHATANAWDIAGFRLKGGGFISVKHHWHSKGRKADFLREVHARACKYFRVALSPEFNRAHHDHFHFDRGALWRCK